MSNACFVTSSLYAKNAGNLRGVANGVSAEEIKDVFARFGPLTDTDITLNGSTQFGEHYYTNYQVIW
jgi:hypothetical protein